MRSCHTQIFIILYNYYTHTRHIYTNKIVVFYRRAILNKQLCILFIEFKNETNKKKTNEKQNTTFLIIMYSCKKQKQMIWML